MTMFRGLVLAALVAGAARGQAERPPALELAESYLRAHASGDRSAQAILAARPAHAVSYTLAVQELLDRGELEAAAALAEQRGGPERDGLQRLVEVWRSGQRPTPAQGRALADAQRALADDDGTRALALLEGAGEPIPGTLLAVRIVWARAHALRLADRSAASVAEFARCARLAEEIGWWRQVREAARAGMQVARAHGEREGALAAADRLVEATRRLDHRETLLPTLVQRSRVRAALGEDAGARADLVEAIAVAQSLGRKLEEAQLQANLALRIQVGAGQPRTSLRHHEEAARLLRELDRPDLLAQVLHNLASARTEAALYADALAAVDEGLAAVRGLPERDARLETALLARRAYVGRRLGRLRSSLDDYRAALDRAVDEERRRVIALDLADLQLERGDLDAATALFEDALEHEPGSPRARAGRALCRAARGDESGARADFDAALAAAPDDVARARLLLPRAAVERSWGDLGAAAEHARDALKRFLEHAGEDHGNTAVTYGLVGDLLLLAGRPADALELLARASVYFQRLRDPGRAVPAYTREALVLLSEGRGEEAVERAGWLREMARAAGPAAESRSLVVDALLADGAGLREQALEKLARAVERAREAGDPEREATARAVLGSLEPERAPEEIAAAFALLDARRTGDVERQPVVVGEHPWNAAGMGIAALLVAETVDADRRAGLLLRWIERARAERVRLSLGGRDAILHAMLPPELHAAWVAARSALLEARARGAEQPDAERRFDAFVERVRTEAPAVAALAFPRPLDAAAVRAGLRGDEALLLYHDDAFGRTLLVVDADGVHPLAYDPERPLDAAAGLLEGKRRLLVSPDGPLAAVSFEAAPWGDGVAGDAFAIAHVPSAAWLLRRRAAGPGGGDPVERPVEARVLLSSGRAAWGDDGALACLVHAPEADGPVVAPGVVLVPGDAPRAGALAALVEALSRSGTADVLLARRGSIDADLVAHARDADGGFADAWRDAVRAARAAGAEPAAWAGAILYAAD